MKYKVELARQATRDLEELPPKLVDKFKQTVIDIISQNPYIGKKLSRELKGYYSLRLTLKHRIVYSIDNSTKTVFVLRAKSHYGE